MSENSTPPSHRDRVNRDAGIISGFFGTAAGVWITIGLLAAAAACAVWSVVTGW